ncbi:MAG: sensor domain-containing protein [Acidimicrobiales bacterium]
MDNVIAQILAPWTTTRTWRALAFIMLAILLGSITFSITIALLATSAGLAITFPLALPFAWLLFTCVRAFGRFERSRLSALLDVDIADPHAPLPEGSWFKRLMARVKSASHWREVAYFVLALPVGALQFAVATAVWSGSLALVALPLYVNSLPGDTAEFGLFDIGSGTGTLAMCALGLVGLVFIAPWVTLAIADIDAALGRALLGPSKERRLAGEVRRVEARRLSAVDSAEAERRRIERDLHDGAQQRLVALAMDLGMARERFADDPEHAQQLVAEAHEEAKAALVELRDLVRGFNPAILQDRGLDAALSAVVARSPIPVRLDVDVSPRPASTVESTAYFVVAEALTNVAKHAHATEARISIARRGDRLAIDVTDNGTGGADQSRGTGLYGLTERVHALGGWMQVLSPVGGPTSVLVELPCA